MDAGRRFLLGAAIVFAVSTAAIVACVGDDGGTAPSVASTPEAGPVAETAPPGASLGTACTTDATCGSGHCADGVCCDLPCTGVCESCALANKGTCSPIAANTDPENECINLARDIADAGAGVDAGASDAGGLDLPPDGGSISLSACAGSCDGNRACAYPGNETSCGPTFCEATTVPETYQCDGKGSCGAKKSSCVDFNCNGGTCRTNCGSNTDCQATDYCGTTGTCVPKKANGIGCEVTAECTSSFCVGAVGSKLCCNSACSDTGMQCDVSGQEGTCSCGGLTCANGCQLFYKDADGDGQGDVNGSIAASTAVAGCVGDAPKVIAGKTYYPTATDCDDTDPTVFKGQTAFFDTANPHVGFDYDCSGGLEKEQPEYPGRSCEVCTLYYPGPNDAECYAESSCASQCCGRASQAGFNCGFACPSGGGYECCPFPTDPYHSEQGFEEIVPCGLSASWHVCGVCNTQPTNTSNTPVDSVSGTKPQRCH